jgi:hydroxypyruvate isomerase
MIGWSLNIGTLLREYSFLDRFQAAVDLGFGAVEFWWPAGIELDKVVKAVQASGVKIALFNADAGDIPAGDRGFLGDPARADYVRANFKQCLDLAATVDCKTIHVLGGNQVASMSRVDQQAAAANMQRELCSLAALKGVTVTLEPQNRLDGPRYLFSSTAEALAQIKAVGAPNLKLQYDVYHAQRMEGSITATIRENIRQIAHIQVADVPGRNHPGTGELNYPFIFEQIQASGYAGYVGLEYLAPNNETVEALAWLPKDQRSSYDAAKRTSLT